jgi:hypothetical protein
MVANAFFAALRASLLTCFTSCEPPRAFPPFCSDFVTNLWILFPFPFPFRCRCFSKEMRVLRSNFVKYIQIHSAVTNCVLNVSDETYNTLGYLRVSDLLADPRRSELRWLPRNGTDPVQYPKLYWIVLPDPLCVRMHFRDLRG